MKFPCPMLLSPLLPETRETHRAKGAHPKTMSQVWRAERVGRVRKIGICLAVLKPSLVLGPEEKCCLQISELGWNLGQDAAPL